MDRDAGGLDPQEIVERQRVAPLLQRQHDLARVQREQMIGQAPDVVAVDRGGHGRGAVVHADEADHGEARAARGGQRLDPRRPRAGAEHQHAPLQPLAAERRLQRGTGDDQCNQRDPHRVEQAGAPEADRREDEEDHRQCEDAERDRDQQAGGGEADRLQSGHRIDPDRDHRCLQRAGEGEQVRQPGHLGIDLAAELPQAQRPARFGGEDQQGEVDHAEQQHRIGHIMFEQPDHRPRAPLEAGGAGCAVSVGVSFSDTGRSVG